jgi:hypothetical protein
MQAVVRRNRIDISGVNILPPSSWDTMLDELRSEYIPGQTPFGKRMLVLANGVFIFRINALFKMADTDIVRILDKYGIAATVERYRTHGATN